MKLIYTKNKWEASHDSLDSFLARAKRDGFSAVEVFLPGIKESPAEIRKQVADHGLLFVAQIITSGKTPAEHIESMKRLFAFAVETQPLHVNSHTGRDIFTMEENLTIYRKAVELSRQAGVLFTHETHRGRPLTFGPTTRAILEAIPELWLNADFSHWFCAHESDLSDQPENLEAAIQRARYIHARVGFEEGPQVPDPLAPEWMPTTEKFVAIWQRIIDARRAAGDPHLCICPEFGPPPYMPIEPHTQRPLADAWTVNVAMFRFLQERLR